MSKHSAVNKGKFRIGTVFVGKRNGVYMQIVDIFQKPHCNCPSAIVKDLHSGKISRSNIPTLECLDAEIIPI